ncbi:MAG TPA: hypothetical protein VK348_00540 [Planctomycetota bacterium]|nr:hypothetical protein [Planctomycetota bacterium]
MTPTEDQLRRQRELAARPLTPEQSLIAARDFIRTRNLPLGPEPATTVLHLVRALLLGGTMANTPIAELAARAHRGYALLRPAPGPASPELAVLLRGVEALLPTPGTSPRPELPLPPVVQHTVVRRLAFRAAAFRRKPVPATADRRAPASVRAAPPADGTPDD